MRHRPGRGEHRGRDVVLGRDQAQRVVLAPLLGGDQLGDAGVGGFEDGGHGAPPMDRIRCPGARRLRGASLPGGQFHPRRQSRHAHETLPDGSSDDRALRPRRDPRRIRAVHLLGLGDREPPGARRARHPGGLRPGHLAGRLDRGAHGHPRPERGQGHHPARHLDGLREPAQPGPRLLGRHRVLHPRDRRPGRTRRRGLGDSDRARRRRPPRRSRRPTSRPRSAASGTRPTSTTTPATRAAHGSA